MPPWRDISVEAGTSYTYRFYFLDDGDNALPPQLGIGALVTPGIYQGTLHTTAALQGPDAQAGNITLAKDAILTIDGVHLTGGSISDDAGRQDTLCSSEVGRVTAAGAAFQDTVFHLCNPTSSVKSSYGNATVNIFAAASVTGNTLASVVVSDESAGHAVIEDNIFVGTGVQVTGESQATIRGCEFQQSSYARFRDQSSGTVEKCTFDSDASVPVLLETKNNVTVYGNEIKLKNSA
jgi:hypothetical protein